MEDIGDFVVLKQLVTFCPQVLKYIYRYILYYCTCPIFASSFVCEGFPAKVDNRWVCKTKNLRQYCLWIVLLRRCNRISTLQNYFLDIDISFVVSPILSLLLMQMYSIKIDEFITTGFSGKGDKDWFSS